MVKPIVLKLSVSPIEVKEIDFKFKPNPPFHKEVKSIEGHEEEYAVQYISEYKLADMMRSLYESQFTKYIIINPKNVVIVHLIFRLGQTSDISSYNFIGKLVKTYRNLNVFLSKYRTNNSIICSSDAHTNIVQFLYPFIYAERIAYKDIGDFIRTPSKVKLMESNIQVINLGDYLIRDDTHVYHTFPYLIRYLNGEIVRYIKALSKGQDVFLLGNHDEELVRAGILKRQFACTKTIGRMKYFLIHAPFKREIFSKLISKHQDINSIDEGHFYLFEKFWHSTGMNPKNIGKCLNKAVTRMKKFARDEYIFVLGHEYAYHFVGLAPNQMTEDPHPNQETCLATHLVDNFIYADKHRELKPGCVLCTDAQLAATSCRFLEHSFHPYLEADFLRKFGRNKPRKTPVKNIDDIMLNNYSCSPSPNGDMEHSPTERTSEQTIQTVLSVEEVEKQLLLKAIDVYHES